MSSARHRGPVHRGIQDLLLAMWPVVAVRRRVGRRAAARVYGATPVEIASASLSIADVIAAATTSYSVVEPCPWGLSAGACVKFHPDDHVSRFAQPGPWPR